VAGIQPILEHVGHATKLDRAVLHLQCVRGRPRTAAAAADKGDLHCAVLSGMDSGMVAPASAPVARVAPVVFRKSRRVGRVRKSWSSFLAEISSGEEAMVTFVWASWQLAGSVCSTIRIGRVNQWAGSRSLTLANGFSPAGGRPCAPGGGNAP